MDEQPDGDSLHWTGTETDWGSCRKVNDEFHSSHVELEVFVGEVQGEAGCIYYKISKKNVPWQHALGSYNTDNCSQQQNWNDTRDFKWEKRREQIAKP